MISIFRAGKDDSETIVNIGKISVREAHDGSCPDEILDEYIAQHYNLEAIGKELLDEQNVYHIIRYNGKDAGFSKVVFNASHAAIDRNDTTKLDRIYLLREFQGHHLGKALMEFNIELAKKNSQTAIWLFTWVGNKKAIGFYERTGFKIIGSHDFHVSRGHHNSNHHMMLEFDE